MVGVSGGLFVSVRWSARSSWSSMKRASHSLPRRLSHLSRLGRGRRRFASCRTFASCHDPRAARQRPCQACRASGRPTSGGRSRSRSEQSTASDARLREARAGLGQARPPGVAAAALQTLFLCAQVPCHPLSRERVDRRPRPRGAAMTHLFFPEASRRWQKRRGTAWALHGTAAHATRPRSPSQPFVFVGRPQASSAETFPYPLPAGTRS